VVGRRLTRRRFVRLLAGATLATTATGVGGFLYVRDVEPGWVDLESVRLILPHLPAAFNGYRLVQLSDIHMDDWMTSARLAAVVRAVNATAPDAIAISGDFVTYEPRRFLPDLVTVLRGLRARDGVVATLGNHDHWTDAGLVRRALADAGVHELSNDVRTLRRGEAALSLAGIDDYWEQRDRLDVVLERLPSAGAAILLAHEPDFADISATTGRFDLQLSGHSHGGQVHVPLLGSPVVPPFSGRYPIGRYQVGGMVQYTNRGLGMVRPYVRLGCRPEITLFTLAAPRA
jgi:uncharacterized protein